MLKKYLSKQTTLYIMIIAIVSLLLVITSIVLSQTVRIDPYSEETKVSEEQSQNVSHDNGDYKPSNSKKNTSGPAKKPITLVAANNPANTVLINESNNTFITKDNDEFPLRVYKTLEVNDPEATQWWTTDIDLDTAWSIGAGETQTSVAVIDTGFALNHEEFTDRWLENENEKGIALSENPSQLNCTDQSLPLDKSCNLIDDNYDTIIDNESGAVSRENPSKLNCTDQSLSLDKSCNLIDDDSDGYIDNVIGWDFINYDSSPQAGVNNPFGAGTTHGTKVSGVLAATGNNAKGIAGVDWSTKILPLQAMNDDSYGNTLTVARAIYYAVEMNVDVISMSLGTDAPDTYIRNAMQYALDNGTIMVVSSGNENSDLSYPARYPEAIAVGSYNSLGERSSFSNYGETLDLVAPGEGIRTTSWSSTNPTSLYASSVSGTSFSAPLVSGLLSLARSHQPNASWGEITNALLSTAGHTGLSVDEPFLNTIGSGYSRAGSLLTKVSSEYTPGIKYLFTPTTSPGTLASNNIFQCIGSDFPTAPFYEITAGIRKTYTIDTLESIRAADRGETVSNIGRLCVGLPTDRPVTVRNVNLISEIGNFQNYKASY